ncbi:peptidase U32 family protein [Desulfoluna spongiiphila]|uniref:Putative protease n=1 Tax=Desulfoluna spongiiphila TaxID=419481 RepID=A0A1G5IKC9_9BACT|nr:U32 family peptidase [Desulfoluna spongiiphila]SCY76512.1 putative protease [Desulfoluna spongiiphila]
MKTDLEILAPGGDIDAIKAAIAAGADAVYCGLNKFNARDRATNLSADDLPGILTLAHKHGCSVFLTLNIIVVESEIPALIRLLNTLVNTRIDAVIVQDFGVFYLLNKHFPSLVIHASTQLTTHNEGQMRFLSALKATRANLSRELSLTEITALTAVGRTHGVETEVFVHGSYCISFSGLCYVSSVLAGKSGNRGRCSQPCRDGYGTTATGNDYPLNLKDNSAYGDLRELAEAGVYSLKIEGRIKKFDYVYTVVNCWRNQIRSLTEDDRLLSDTGDLYKVFNRDFSNGFLKGNITGDMFIDNPRDHSIRQLSQASPSDERDKERNRFYEDKAELSARARHAISRLRIEKVPLTFCIEGKADTPLRVSITTPETSFHVDSARPLAPKANKSAPGGLSLAVLREKFKRFDNAEYRIEQINTEALQPDLYLSFKELTVLSKRIAFLLNGSREPVAPVAVPSPGKPRPILTPPALSVVISSPEDAHLCGTTPAEIFFRLPEAMEGQCDELARLFREYPGLTPWFPPVLIGTDYTAALAFLDAVRPARIVTDNTGIAHEACRKGIAWIAGPCFNIANSFSLLCLAEQFACSGAFLSQEIKKDQLKRIVRPEGMELCTSIFHPISLMTSRQCLHHQVTGCDKNRFDRACVQGCATSSSITRENGTTLHIHKTKGNHHRLYHETHCLNTEVVTDLPHTFSRFFIDLRDIGTHTKTEEDKAGLITLFDNLLKGKPDAGPTLHRKIRPTTNVQYIKGI